MNLESTLKISYGNIQTETYQKLFYLELSKFETRMKLKMLYAFLSYSSLQVQLHKVFSNRWQEFETFVDLNLEENINIGLKYSITFKGIPFICRVEIIDISQPLPQSNDQFQPKQTVNYSVCVYIVYHTSLISF